MQEAKDARPQAEAKADVRPPEAAASSKRTPAEWAVECGNVDPSTREGGRQSAKAMKAWRHAAAAAFCGWGTRLPADLPMTRKQYEDAVNAALSLPLGDAKNDAALKRLAAKEQAR